MAIEIDARSLQLSLVEGQAFDVRSSSEIVYGQQYSVLANGTLPTASEKKETNFWVKDGRGQDYSVTVPAALELRNGHDVRIAYARWNDEDFIYPIAVQNNSMKTLYRRDLDDIITRFAIRLRSDSGCGGALMTLFTLFGAPVLGAIVAGQKGATLAFVFGLSVFVPYVLIPPHRAKKKRQALSEALDKELRQMLSK